MLNKCLLRASSGSHEKIMSWIKGTFMLIKALLLSWIEILSKFLWIWLCSWLLTFQRQVLVLRRLVGNLTLSVSQETLSLISHFLCLPAAHVYLCFYCFSSPCPCNREDSSKVLEESFRDRKPDYCSLSFWASKALSLFRFCNDHLLSSCPSPAPSAGTWTVG